ncbi:MAG: leucine-rich repeat domain-containing protein, partial [Clostridia bacterium]|nr:leucine-rich repeat domain-containing protein [Clostridia bacterium]
EYLTAGDYYLQVSGHEDFDVGKYSIKVITDDYSNTFETAENINIGSIINAAINDLYDADMFRFTVDVPGIYTITSDLDLEGAADTYAVLFDDNKEDIEEDDDSGSGLNFEMVEYLEKGTYYLKVEGYAVGNYRIAIKGDTEEIIFNDSNFGAAVTEALGIKEGGVYSGDCLEIKVLDLSNKSIKDISDLSYFKNLISVDLSNNHITTIPNLDFDYLMSMDLSSNQITTIPSLDFSTLRSLDLSNNNISDISVLNSLDSLDELYLSNNNISDISALSEMDLVFLMIDANDITDITPLKNKTI